MSSKDKTRPYYVKIGQDEAFVECNTPAGALKGFHRDVGVQCHAATPSEVMVGMTRGVRVIRAQMDNSPEAANGQLLDVIGLEGEGKKPEPTAVQS